MRNYNTQPADCANNTSDGTMDTESAAKKIQSVPVSTMGSGILPYADKEEPGSAVMSFVQLKRYVLARQYHMEQAAIVLFSNR